MTITFESLLLAGVFGPAGLPVGGELAELQVGDGQPDDGGLGVDLMNQFRP
jgi:hypothetical protein